MVDVIDELTPGNTLLDHDRVVRRIEDWQERLRRLYDQICAWLPEGITTDRAQSLPMNEKVMQTFDVAEAEVPILSLYDRGERIARLVPNGLWVIGNNGWVKLFKGGANAVIIDRSQIFEPPLWRISPADRRLTADHRLNESALTAETFLEALRR